MKTSLFDFHLPESLIATHPVNPRDAARMLVIADSLQDKIIRDLPQFLRPGDVIVFNDTKVIPARLLGKRGEAKVEVLLHRRPAGREASAQDLSQIARDPVQPLRDSQDDSLWQCFAKPAKRLKPGDRIDFISHPAKGEAFAQDLFFAEVLEKQDDGQMVLAFKETGVKFYQALEKYGHIPLPPYIRRNDDASDRSHYQTIYAKHEGSVAAPTAGLHFTPKLLDAIDAAGIQRAHVTLHVGGGTFLPVKSDDTEDHVMHSEWAEISGETADIINKARSKGGRIIAVGTTSLRTLESAADADGRLKANSFETNIFITPGYKFKIVDQLLTNFHLPRSTLFMLAAAFSGLERMQAAYAHAIRQNYRFYSYGDACLLFKA